MTPPPAATPPTDKIRGVFSAQKVMKVGTGATTRKTVQQTYYFVQETDDGEIELQPLNKNFVPSGAKETITKDDLLQDYAPEPEFYQSTVYPKIRKLQATLARADRHRKHGETFSAEMEYSSALAIDEENVRANFGIGLCYLQRGENAKAEDILNRLVRLEATYAEEHKHMFNEFGISLRKSRLYAQAVDYYSKALDVSPGDENLHYNVARALYELGRFDETQHHLERALSLNPALEEAGKFLRHLMTKRAG